MIIKAKSICVTYGPNSKEEISENGPKELISNFYVRPGSLQRMHQYISDSLDHFEVPFYSIVELPDSFSMSDKLISTKKAITRDIYSAMKDIRRIEKGRKKELTPNGKKSKRGSNLM